MKRVLVTGGNGLIGHALRHVLPEAIYVGRQEADLRHLSEVQKLLDKHRPDAVIHLAADVGGVKRNAEANAELFASNVLINANVLSVAEKSGVERLLSVLSTCAYQFYPDRPSTEDDLHVGQPFGGNLGYGLSKRMLDMHAKLLWQDKGFQATTITPVTVYGPHDNWDLEMGHVIGALIHRAVLAKRDHKPLLIWGSGRAIRQFVYAPDVARLILQVLDSIKEPDTLIIAPDQGMTIKHLAEQVAKAVGFKGELIFDVSKPEGELVRVVKSQKFSARFPNFHFTSLEEGLKETVKWFICHSEAEGRRISARDPSLRSG